MTVMSPVGFLDLPPEIRNLIYVHLLVDEDIFYDDGNKMVLDRYGGIILSETHPMDFKPEWRRTSYTCPDVERTTRSRRRLKRRTYYTDELIDLKLFYTCRQIYEEASSIFYSNNRFYVYEMNTLLPFLWDRPARARGLIEKISIFVPYGLYEKGRLRNKNPSTFTRFCSYLASHPGYLPNLKQLDIRMEIHGPGQRHRDHLDLQDMRVPVKRVRQLASIVDPHVVTLSLLNWHFRTMYHHYVHFRWPEQEDLMNYLEGPEMDYRMWLQRRDVRRWLLQQCAFRPLSEPVRQEMQRCRNLIHLKGHGVNHSDNYVDDVSSSEESEDVDGDDDDDEVKYSATWPRYMSMPLVVSEQLLESTSHPSSQTRI